MRLALLIVMMVLMPLRALAADLMAIEMASENQNATHLVAAYAISTGVNGTFGHQIAAAVPADCPGHAAPTSDQTADLDTSASTDHGPHCSSCQVCHSAACNLPLALDLVLPMAHSAPDHAGWMAHSVAAAPSFKPPIS